MKIKLKVGGGVVELTPHMSAHIRWGLAGMTASTEKALEARKLIERYEHPRWGSGWRLSSLGEAVRDALAFGGP